MNNINHDAISDAKSAKQKASMVQKFLASTSVGVITMIMAGSAYGQVLPGDCAPNPLVDGGTSTCVAPAPIIIDPIETDTDNVTLNIGSLTTPTSVGSVFGDAIHMAGNGNQTLNIINAGSSVIGQLDGVDIRITGGIGNLNIANSATVIGGNFGILANHDALGNIFIRSSNAVGTGVNGIEANISNLVNAGDITIVNEENATGGSYGIVTVHQGLGGITILSNGTVNGLNSGGITADLTNFNGNGQLLVSATNDVVGQEGGITANVQGDGDLTIEATNVMGVTLDGVSASSFKVGDISVTATGDVSGGANGITTTQLGSGGITIDAMNSSGSINNGIRAFIASSGNSEIAISSSGDATGGENGIMVDNAGKGNVTISAFNADGSSRNGVAVLNSDLTGGNIAVEVANSATGGETGIYVENDGLGRISVIANNATGTTEAGISAINTSNFNANKITISATGDVSGGGAGIQAGTDGLGALNISAANVSGATKFGIGAVIQNIANVNEISVSATGDVTGGEQGIITGSAGTGSISVVAGNVTGTNAVGIGADGGGDISIEATGDIFGGKTGVVATSRGLGRINVEVVGVTAVVNNAIVAAISDSNNLADITIAATGDVSGGEGGIIAFNNGSGAISISTAGVNGTLSDGINADNNNSNGTGDVSVIASGDVVGGQHGLRANNNGTANLIIEAAAVTGGTGDGILATTQGLDLFVNATGLVTGGDEGIEAINNGFGDLTLVVADVTGVNDAGIRARIGEVGTTGNLSVTATSTVRGETLGARIQNLGLGATDVSISNVISATQSGVTISVDNVLNTADTSVSIGDITADNFGLSVTNSGSGNTSVTAGNVTAAGGVGIAIDAGTGDLALNVSGNISGTSGGIRTITMNGTTFTLGAGQTVSGGTLGSVGIATLAQGGSATSNDNLTILGTVNNGISTFQGDDILTLGLGSTVNGDIRGGDGFDTINFNAAGDVINNSGDPADGIAEVETYNFNNGSYTVAGSHIGLTAANFNAGNHNLSGSLQSNDVAINSGASLQAVGGAAIIGDLNNAGEFTVVSNDGATVNIDGNLLQSATGSIAFDLSGPLASDPLTVTGGIALAGTLNLTGADVFVDSITLINGAIALAGNFDTVIGLSSGLLVSRSIELDGNAFDVNLTSSIIDAATIEGLSPNQIALANNLTTQLADGDLNDGLTDIANGLAFLDNVGDLGSSLDQLSPEIADVGIQVFQNSQLAFMTNLFNQQNVQGQNPDTMQNGSAGGSKTPARNGTNVWGSMQFNHVDQNGSFNNIGFNTNGFEIATGVSDLGSGPVTFGIAGGYARLTSDTRGFGSDHVVTDIFRIAAHATVGINPEGPGLNARFDGALGFAAGSNDIDLRIDAPVIGLDVEQSASTDINSFSAVARFQIDGTNGKSWPVKPYVLGAWETVRQDSFNIGDTAATSLDISGVKADRFTIGYGAVVDHAWDQGTFVQLRASGLHHFGDTQTVLASQFTSVSNGGLNFTTNGSRVNDQYVIEANVGHRFGDGWTIAAEAEGQFGDLKGYTGRLRLTKRF